MLSQEVWFKLFGLKQVTITWNVSQKIISIVEVDAQNNIVKTLVTASIQDIEQINLLGNMVRSLRIRGVTYRLFTRTPGIDRFIGWPDTVWTAPIIATRNKENIAAIKELSSLVDKELPPATLYAPRSSRVVVGILIVIIGLALAAGVAWILLSHFSG